jgi:methyltransferase
MSAGWIFLIYLCERLFEICLARRNARLLAERGAREYARNSFRPIVIMHSLFWAALMVEAWPWQLRIDLLTIGCLTALALLMALRYWCIVTLGIFWNTRIIVTDGMAPIRTGPYRWLRHPNYLVVVLEFALLPLLLRAPVTLMVFSVANLLLLRKRIALEESAMAGQPGLRGSFFEESS